MKIRALALASLTLAATGMATTANAALAVGATAPDFTAPAFLAGQPFSFHLAEALKKGPVVLYFFPATHTAGCNIEAHEFAEAADQFKALGATVIGVTAGKVDELQAFSKETEFCSGKFPVAADTGAAIAKSYDSKLAIRPDLNLSDRTSYVVAKNGKIVLAYSDLKPDEHVNQTLAAVKALKK
jgi:peroxiredoxin Q/BCP